ncbi:MAG: NADH-dependent phenylglyoxylate dehydrogenase subunit delta [Chloroflexi bacterium]|nr:NADH-dependent phenylglyoxylate dehydrogenase subunit delta [Chloroflexota bacterium]MBT9163370.1 NADH-dependent phenylglyoxylate dehydrogenase subunit delta [Chloroflexota bacterium]
MEFKTKYQAPWAEASDLFILPVSGWRSHKPVVKTSKCRHCGGCYLFCPTGCIEDKGVYFEANVDYCKGCGLCAAECPVMAIAMIREETA